MPRLDWNDIRFFLELAERRTLASTGRALHVTHVTVARHLASLEKAVGTQLFERRQDGYVLTRAGQRLHFKAQPMQRIMESVEFVREAGDATSASGKVRVTATRAMTDLWLAERLARFQVLHPRIAVDVLGTDDALSLASRQADVALRLFRPDRGNLTIQRISTLGFAFYAAQHYLEQVPRHAWQFISYAHDSQIPEAVWLRKSAYGQRIVFVTDSLLGQRTAAEHGVGVGLLPCYVGDASVSLVQVDFPDSPPQRDLWMVTLPSVRRNKAVRAVIDYLVALFDTDSERFRGSPTSTLLA